MRYQINLKYFSQEKTEKATPKKRQESRKKGQVAKSADINAAFVLFVSVMFLSFMGGWMGERLKHLFTHSLEKKLLYDVTETSIPKLFWELSIEVAIILAPVMIAAMAAGVIGNYLQVGFLFSTEAIQMKLERINPLSGFKRIYSVRALVELSKSLLKILLIGGVTFFVLWMERDVYLRMSLVSIESSLPVFGGLAIKMGFAASLVLLFLAFLDYMYQKYDFEKNIRMSKQDIKDEYKKSEGDPKIKGKIKEKQRQMAMRRMMQEVPKADVIITNPTHYAICLKYDDSGMDAPVVIAKGVDLIAQRIKEIGKEHNVVAVENKPLARTLYARVEIGQVIPEDLFKAVAEILAFVYRIKKKV
ncbi:flagellar biosynthesis protein FlhB [Fictibacillus phosphorivorans]|uniref:flagellar biosynthesis protein FlhB n=1 Tax=Fictibacillus phosphorivorans TaxID=1221500 RepID=UPI00203FE77C|nr:flagellar biosynthesis protein FlhB [Fictibacillus phosphorivorans]MCM3717143.1 flagellar biosynthesis protein FlhB [Fictibacillus phosphorivorans]MCM3774830.1 flagellar biosynthesis protein FlhB [Fictibacillus phosphorivorans]